MLRLGFIGLAGYFLFLAYQLSRQLIGEKTTDRRMFVEKRKTLLLYGGICGVALVLSVGVEVGKMFSKPAIPPWVNASALGQLSEEELATRPIEISTWQVGAEESTFKSFKLTSRPNPIQLPSSGGMITVSVSRGTTTENIVPETKGVRVAHTER
jgi:hypothetical protein